MKKILFTIIVSATLVACTNEQTGKLSNIFMNKNSFEKLIDRFENQERDATQKPEKVIDLLGEIKGKKIMDIGAGTGYFSFRMASRGADIIAADVDDRFIDYMNKRKSESNDQLVQTRKVEYDDPLLSPQEVDHVLIVNTYHHIDDREEYFVKVLNGIKSSGSLMVVDFKKNKKCEGPPKRYRVTTQKVIKELEAAGFKRFEVNTELLENQYVIIAYP